MLEISKYSIQFFKNKVSMQQIFDFCSNTSLKTTHSNYIFCSNIEGEYKAEHKTIVEVLFLFRNSNSLMVNLIDKCKEEQWSNLAHFICHLFYENILNSSFVQEDLLSLIYLLLEKELTKSPLDLNIFFENSFLAQFLISLTRKEDVRSYLTLIISEMILNIEKNTEDLFLFNVIQIEESFYKSDSDKNKRQYSYYTNNTIDTSNKEQEIENSELDYNQNNTNDNLSTIIDEIKNSSITKENLEKMLSEEETKDFASKHIHNITKNNNDINLYSNQSLLDQISEYNILKQMKILTRHQQIIFTFKSFILNLIHKLTDNITSIPYIIKCILKIIDLQLTEKKLNSNDKYLFISKVFFDKIILPIILKPDYNGVITTNIISSNTKEILKVINRFLSKLCEDNLFKTNVKEESDMVILNSFILEIRPKVMNFILSICNTKLPSVIQKLISDKNKSNRDIEYDYFKENRNENMRHQALCFNYSDIMIFIDTIEANREVFINSSNKVLIENCLSQANTIEKLQKDNHVTNTKTYIYTQNLVFKPDFEQKLKFNECWLGFDKILSYSSNKIVLNESDYLNRVKYCLSIILQNINTITSSSLNLKQDDTIDKFINSLNYQIKYQGIDALLIENQIPLSWFGIFLGENINNIPEKEKANKFQLLFDLLFKEADQNLKEAKNNVINQFYLKIKNSEKLNMIITNNLQKLKQMEKIIKIEQFVEKIKIPINLTLLQNDKKELSGLTITTNNTSFMCDSIKGFIDIFPNFQNIKGYIDIIEYERQIKVDEELCNYFAIVQSQLNKEIAFSKYSKEEIKAISQDIENYIRSKLYTKLFPEEESQADISLYNKCCRLSFLKPQNLLKNTKVINEKLWITAMEYINLMDKEKTPVDKLKSFNKAYSIIENSITFCTGKGELGVDDNIPVLIYVIIKAKPRKIVSNLQYSKLFINPELTLKNYGLLLSQLEMVIEVVNTLKVTDLFGLSQEEFDFAQINLNNESTSFKI